MKKGMFRPGTRRRRWRQSSAVNIAVFGLATVMLLSAGSPLLALPCAWLCWRGCFDYRHGWPIRYDLPPWGKEQIQRPGLGGDVARAAWARTQKAAKDPNRKRYAFD